MHIFISICSLAEPRLGFFYVKEKNMVVSTKTKILLGLGCLTAVGIFVFLNKTGNNIQKLKPKKGAITEAIYGLGTVTSRNQFSFKIGTPKTVQQVSVTEGDDVKKGDLLLTLSEGFQVRAPFSGTVVSRPYNPGENVFSDQPIVVMHDLKDLYVLAQIDQQGALRVREGMTVKLSFESVRNQVFLGKVKSLFPKNSQFMAHIEVQGLPKEVLPGMTADVAIEVATKNDVLLIPGKAIQNGVINRSRAGKVEKVILKIGLMDEEWAEVLSGDVQLEDEILTAR